MPASYPVVADLQALLIGAGLLSNPPTEKQQMLPWESYVLTARREWEGATGFKPFLSGDADTERAFSPDIRGSGVIDLGAGLLSASAIMINGEACQVDRDVFLMPENAAEEGQPYTWLEFACRRYGPRRCIVVTGRWGYCQALPDDVFNAVLSRAAWHASGPVAAAADRPMEQVKQDDVEIRYASSVTERTAHISRWEDAWNTALANYRMETIG